MSRPLKPCGTPAAYARHLYHDEEPCRRCRHAVNAYQRAYRKGELPASSMPMPQPCGTPAAYFRHINHCEDACRPCKDAVAAYYRQRRAYWKAA